MDLTLDWPELYGLLFIVVGFGLAIVSRNAFVTIAVIGLMGLSFGRTWFRCKKQSTWVPLFITMMFFLIGFFVGSFFANLQISIMVFLGGTLAGYKVHEKRVIPCM